LILIGVLASVFSIKWLISSAEMFEVSDELKEDYTKNKTLDEETQTGFIVKMMAYYRENKPTIKKMRWVSRIAGFCFLISGAFTIITVVINASTGVQLIDVWMQVLGAFINFAISAVGFIIPHFLASTPRFGIKELKRTQKLRLNSEGNWGKSNMKQKRTHYEIYWEILTFCKTPDPSQTLSTDVTLTRRLDKHISIS
jgi:hypothetical protein